jgi:hypothetical protein
MAIPCIWPSFRGGRVGGPSMPTDSWPNLVKISTRFMPKQVFQNSTCGSITDISESCQNPFGWRNRKRRNSLFHKNSIYGCFLRNLFFGGVLVIMLILLGGYIVTNPNLAAVNGTLHSDTKTTHVKSSQVFYKSPNARKVHE